jgi:hypothetical protein
MDTEMDRALTAEEYCLDDNHLPGVSSTSLSMPTYQPFQKTLLTIKTIVPFSPTAVQKPEGLQGHETRQY